MTFFPVFGNTPDLSQLEYNAVMASGGDVLEQAPKLGGTVKIVKELGVFTDEDELISKISTHLLSLHLPKIDFGVSGHPNISKDIKKHLEAEGVKTRFVLPKDGSELSSVVVRKQKLIDIVVQGDKIGQTVWVQDFEDWNKRDYGRPAVDPHAGMLPPKIARMMVNIAISTKQVPTILDPFCGVGTVLAEGLMVGCEVFGSDVSSLQVDRTKKNLDWLGRHPFKVFQSDARNVAQKMFDKVNAIVTEPDLGPNNENNLRSHMANLREKLGYLYLSSLENWKNILKPGGKVVMVIPSFNFSAGKTVSKDKELDLVKMVIDRAKIMGYIEFNQPITYHRPQAVVKRNICFLTYGTH